MVEELAVQDLMKDPRFGWILSSTAYHAQRRREEQALLDSLPELSLLREELRAWWRGFATRFRDSADALPVDEGTRLVRKVPGTQDERLLPIIEALSRCLTPNGGDDVMERVARRLLAEEIGRATALGPVSAQAFLQGEDFAGLHADNWEAFHETFLAGCMADENLRNRWAIVLGEIPETLEAYVELFSDERSLLVALHEAERGFQKHKDPMLLWEQRPDFIRISGDVSSRLRVLAVLAPSSLLQILERIPSAQVMRETITYLGVKEDKDWILRALQEAAPVFDAEGWTGKRGLLVWVMAIVDHAEKLEEAVAGAARNQEKTTPPAEEVLKTLRDSDLPEWFRKAFGMLLNRSDGQQVAIAFGAWLAKSAQISRQRQWSAQLAALYALLVELETRGTRLEAIEETSRLLAKKREMPFFLMGCGVELQPEANSLPWEMRSLKVREAAWQWYERMLNAGDDGVIQQVNPYGAVDWPFDTSGAVLAGFEDPTKRWQGTWDMLFRGRQRARFHFAKDELDPSLHLVRTGIGAIKSLLSGTPSEVASARARQLWRALLKALWFLVPGQDGTELLTGPQELARVFACMPRVFGVGWSTELKAVAPLLQTDDVLTLRGAYLLLKNGVEREDLWETFARLGMDLKHIGEEAIAAETMNPGPKPSVTLTDMFQEVVGDRSRHMP